MCTDHSGRPGSCQQLEYAGRTRTNADRSNDIGIITREDYRNLDKYTVCCGSRPSMY